MQSKTMNYANLAKKPFDNFHVHLLFVEFVPDGPRHLSITIDFSVIWVIRQDPIAKSTSALLH